MADTGATNQQELKMGEYEGKRANKSKQWPGHEPAAPVVGRSSLPVDASAGPVGAYSPTFQPHMVPWSGGTSRGTTADDRVREQTQLVEQQTALVASRMNERASMDRDEINVLRYSLDAAGSLLRKSMSELGPGNPLIERASAALTRSNDVRAMLASFANANDAHDTVERQFHPDPGTDYYELAKERNQGFCDLAPPHPLCKLTEKERQDFRAGVKSSVSLIANNWRQAITSSYVDEMFRKNEITFEQQLGQIILGVLFNVVAIAGKSLVGKGVDTAERAASTGVVIEGEWNKIKGPDLTDAKAVATKVVDKGAAKAETAATTHERQVGTLRVKDLVKGAEESVKIPADRAGFLASLESVPGTWETTINGLLKDLFDDDLNVLASVLPDIAPKMTTTNIKKELEAQMTRFEHQVLAVNHRSMAETRPVQVINGQEPIRYALARRKLAPNAALHGEWKNSPARTERWTFVEWIGDDMKDYALTRSMQLPNGGMDVSAAAMITSATDTSFWDEESLPKLAIPPSRHSTPWDLP
ncbi:MAG: hypothetical protein HOV81_15325 [Kofleriaceae bacterium]|nr:hypothetical protein [Kofleriaceae bacterium]